MADHTVPSKYRPIIRNWIISSKDIPEKETAMRQIWLETKAEADENTRQSFHATLQKSITRITLPPEYLYGPAYYVTLLFLSYP